jgi:D-serine deaminase-like pyridoxal phosphate-dependent protein
MLLSKTGISNIYGNRRIVKVALLAKEQIETPALLIDLDAFEYNLHKMADYFRGKRTKLSMD